MTNFMKIIAYSSFENNDVKSNTDNVSNVVDKLVRLAAKITEHYAGDICYIANELANDIQKGLTCEKLICFREDGVDCFDIVDAVDLSVMPIANISLIPMPHVFSVRSGPPDYIQCWLLQSWISECSVRHTKLSRVQISFCES